MTRDARHLIGRIEVSRHETREISFGLLGTIRASGLTGNGNRQRSRCRFPFFVSYLDVLTCCAARSLTLCHLGRVSIHRNHAAGGNSSVAGKTGDQVVIARPRHRERCRSAARCADRVDATDRRAQDPTAAVADDLAQILARVAVVGEFVEVGARLTQRGCVCRCGGRR
jgi:hypothetical protein